MLIDTHAHLTSSRFRGKTGEIVERANRAGVEKIITIACDLPDSRETIAMAKQWDSVFPTVGIHPCYVHEIKTEPWKEELTDLATSYPVSAIGEIGLDYYHAPPEGYSEEQWRERQAEVFEAQLKIARDLNLPVVVHQRESGDDVLDLLEKIPEVRAVLHCFTGTPEQANRALSMGHYLSFTGVVTYPKAGEVREITKLVPSDRFMVETDSPYLAPVPYRGKSNEPAYVVHTAQTIAEERGISEEKCRELTTENALRFFAALS